MARTSRCTGAILAGGGSTRFAGRPKGLLEVGGQRIIDRVATALRAAAGELLVVSNDAAAPSWLAGVPVAGDVHAGMGSLGGLHAALHHAGANVLVVAWDMPFVPAQLLGRLRALGDAGATDAVLPWSPSRRGVEPLCAWYAPTCLPAIEARLAAGDRHATSFLEDVRTTVLAASDVQALGHPETMFMNVNTPEDLARACAAVA